MSLFEFNSVTLFEQAMIRITGRMEWQLRYHGGNSCKDTSERRSLSEAGKGHGICLYSSGRSILEKSLIHFVSPRSTDAEMLIM